MPVISSRISGWRVTDSITLPKMMPMPTPAPTAPRPPTTPRARARPAPSPPTDAQGDRAARLLAVFGSGEDEAEDHGRNVHCLDSLVGFGDRAAEIDGRESGEDERLERGDQPDLEEVDRPTQREEEDADGRRAQQDRQAAGHEQDDEMPG